MNIYEVISEPRQLTLFSVIFRVLVAILLGGTIGLERGLKNRPAGLRTYMLVCLGSCIVMITNQYIYQVYGSGDPVRMGAQVISGIGFLGAGTIMVTPHSQIKGLTTAAGLWASACVGLAIGIGFVEVAVIGSLGIILILTVLHVLDRIMRKRPLQIEVHIELNPSITIGNLIEYARENEIEIRNVQVENKHSSLAQTTALVAELKPTKTCKDADIVQVIRKMDGVVRILPL